MPTVQEVLASFEPAAGVEVLLRLLGSAAAGGNVTTAVPDILQVSGQACGARSQGCAAGLCCWFSLSTPSSTTRRDPVGREGAGIPSAMQALRAGTLRHPCCLRTQGLFSRATVNVQVRKLGYEVCKHATLSESDCRRLIDAVKVRGGPAQTGPPAQARGTWVTWNGLPTCAAMRKNQLHCILAAAL